MTSKECETQLNELLEAWDLDEATLNQTDIEAIKHLLLENQMQQDVIIGYKSTNLDQAVELQQLNEVIEKTVSIAYEYGQIDGDHHKLWVIDQMLRVLLGEDYRDFIEDYEENGEYKWDIGIAP